MCSEEGQDKLVRDAKFPALRPIAAGWLRCEAAESGCMLYLTSIVLTSSLLLVIASLMPTLCSISSTCHRFSSGYRHRRRSIVHHAHHTGPPLERGIETRNVDKERCLPVTGVLHRSGESMI